MDTITELAADERTARIILATVSEPGDAVTGQMIRTLGATEVVARAVADEVPVGPDADTWQRRLAPRLDAPQVRRVLAETERHGMRVLIPGDAESIIAKTVKEQSIDMLIMGAFGHSPLRTLMFGSKTADLLRSSTIPTLLLR